MFNISLSYLGRYFKKHTGETIQQYIANYKIKLIEHRLLHRDMRIKEITQEFGFSDESHFVKFFSKQKGTQPSNYRILFGNNKSE
jgi:AraC family L-rhamnose operon regulatory protein RhaS